MAEYHEAARAVGGYDIYVRASWCKVGKKNLIHNEHPGTFKGVLLAKDIDYLHKVMDDKWSDDTVIFSDIAGIICNLI
ncbi:hypothetical protein PanWU01x14_336140 [Parasponia andersonii]|uniref:Uncharacterized protein n=1 Tax=Parasponia andersonii TaxID=3476 RepID=A0A2P5AG03_PARAD|nr:hypothetical protein PanWU01x14_336140 [Parasponia andersonii]